MHKIQSEILAGQQWRNRHREQTYDQEESINGWDGLEV